MNIKTFILIATFPIFTLVANAQVDLNKIKKEANKLGKEAEKILKNQKPLTNDEVIKGLKEALSVGSKNSSSLASKVDAYYRNPKLFIPFPTDAQKVEKKLREIGLGKKVDEFVVTINRAAEQAAKESAPIFMNAIQKMTIKDGMNILNGPNNAATNYLSNTTSPQLNIAFKPVVSRALQNVQATKYWTDIINTYNKIPGVTKMNPDLAQYVTERAIKGLFVLVAAEELKIRQDPKARVSEILQRVFGYKK